MWTNAKSYVLNKRHTHSLSLCLLVALSLFLIMSAQTNLLPTTTTAVFSLTPKFVHFDPQICQSGLLISINKNTNDPELENPRYNINFPEKQNQLKVYLTTCMSIFSFLHFTILHQNPQCTQNPINNLI